MAYTPDQVRGLKREWKKAEGELMAALNDSPPRLHDADFLKSRRDTAFRAWKRASEEAEATASQKSIPRGS